MGVETSELNLSRSTFHFFAEKTNAKESLRRKCYLEEATTKSTLLLRQIPMQTIFYMPFMQIHTEKNGKERVARISKKREILNCYVMREFLGILFMPLR